MWHLHAFKAMPDQPSSSARIDLRKPDQAFVEDHGLECRQLAHVEAVIA